MKIASYNMHYGVGQDGRLDLGRIVDAIQDCDVIGFQEVDQGWDRSGGIDQVAALAALMPEHEFAFAPGVDVAKGDAAGTPIRHRRRRTGNLVASRFPLLSVRSHILPKFGARQALDIQKSANDVAIAAPIGAFRLMNTHLCHLSEVTRIAQIEFLLAIHARAGAEGPALSGTYPADPSFSSEPPLPEVPDECLVMGDLNLTPDSRAYERLAGADEGGNWGRPIARGGFRDAWVVAGNAAAIGRGDRPEYGVTSANRPRRIDYLFATEALAERIRAVEIRDTITASDHFPLVVTFA